MHAATASHSFLGCRKPTGFLAWKFPASSRGLSREQKAGSQGEPLPPPTPIQQPGTAPTGDTGRATQERPEARRIRSSETCRAGRGLGSPRAGRRVERPPGWALGGPPARAWPALTSRRGGSGSRLQPSPGRAPPDPGPRPKRRRRASSPRAGARPACQRGGRPAVAAAAPFLLCLSFLQPTPRPPRAEPVPRPPGAARRLSSARDAGSVAPARRALSPRSFRQAARSGGAGHPQARGGWGRRPARPTAPAPPAGPLRRVGPGPERPRRAPGSGGARGDSRGSPRAGAREEEEEEERAGCGLVQSLGVLAASARRGDGWE